MEWKGEGNRRRKEEGMGGLMVHAGRKRSWGGPCWKIWCEVGIAASTHRM